MEGKTTLKLKPKFPNLKDFVQKYLVRELPNNWHHHLYYDILDNWVVQNRETGMLEPNYKVKNHHSSEQVRLDRVNQNILCLSPRYHAKSSCFSINYPLYEIYKNPNVRILIVSGNEDIATSFVRAVMNQLETNDELREDFGDLVPKLWGNKKWGEKALVVKRDSIEHSPTLAAVGTGGRLVSRRADIIICDDLIDIDTARTRQMRNKTREWFENVLLPILDPKNGKLIVLGTAWYRDDLYDFLWKESHFDIRLKLKALMYHGAHYKKEGSGKTGDTNYVTGLKYHPADYPLALNDKELFGDHLVRRYKLSEELKCGVLWKDKWSFETLMERKRNMSESSFNRQFLNEPGSEADKIFKESLIDRCKNARMSLLASYDNTAPLPLYGHLIIAVGVDLAISRKETADNSAIAVWGMNERRQRILLDLQFGKWTAEETRARIVEVYHAYRPAKIKVETVAFQEMMRQQLEVDEIPVEGFRTTAGNKFNEETGIAGIAMLMEQDKVVLPGSRERKESYETVNQLKYELISYTYEDHAGDCLMASWFALEALKEFDKKLKDNRGFFDQGALVDQMKKTVAPHRIVLLSDNPRYFKYFYSSYIHIFRSIQMVDGKLIDFIANDEKFFIFVTRQAKTVGYILNKETREIVGKVEGDMTAVMCCNLLERTGRFFNNAQIIIDRNGEGDAVYLEMVKRMYPNLMCLQPDQNGDVVYEEAFKLSSSNIPIIIDSFRIKVDSNQVDLYDDSLLKEMGELISVDGDSLVCSFGDGQRVKTIATGLWLLENYEVTANKKNSSENKKRRQLTVPYKVFNYKK